MLSYERMLRYLAILTVSIPTVLVSMVPRKVPGVSQSKPILSPLHQPRHLPHPAGQHYLHTVLYTIVLYSITHILPHCSNTVCSCPGEVLGPPCLANTDQEEDIVTRVLHTLYTIH